MTRRAPILGLRPPVGVGTGLLVLYLPVLGHAVDVWRSDQEFSFGYLIPPLAAVLLWFRRSSIRAAVTGGRGLGLLAVVGGLLLLLAARRAGIHALGGASFLPTLLGAAAYLYGSAVARLILFPVGLMTVSLSLYRGMLDQLGFALQVWTASGASLLASVLGVPVRRSGVDLFVGAHHFLVAQACSGMDALLALLCLGALFVGLAAAPLLRRIALFSLVLPLILAANVLRVTLVLVLFPHVGSAVSGGIGHQALDAVLFGAAALFFYLSAVVLRCAPRFGATLSSSH